MIGPNVGHWHGAAATNWFADAAVKKFGRLDLIINAGLIPLSALEALKVDDWDRMIGVNSKGVLYGIAAALPRMKEQKRSIITNRFIELIRTIYQLATDLLNMSVMMLRVTSRMEVWSLFTEAKSVVEGKSF